MLKAVLAIHRTSARITYNASRASGLRNLFGIICHVLQDGTEGRTYKRGRGISRQRGISKSNFRYQHSLIYIVITLCPALIRYPHIRVFLQDITHNTLVPYISPRYLVSHTSMLFLRVCRLPVIFDPEDIAGKPSPSISYQHNPQASEDIPVVPNGLQVEVFKDGRRMLSLYVIYYVSCSLNAGVDAQV